MATLQDTIGAIASETTAIASLVALFHGLQDQIATAVKGLTVEQQEQIDAIFAAVSANKETLAAAMAFGVPPDPATTAAPPGA